MSEYVLLNQEMILRELATISVDDSGFLYGFGAYDTLLALNSKPLFMEEHTRRLNESLKALRISQKGFNSSELEDKIIDLLKKNNYKNARVRITVSKGKMNFENVHIDHPNMTFLITTTHLTDNYFNREIKPFNLMVSKFLRNHPLSVPPFLKLTNLANHFFASIDAKEQGYDDGIMINHEGYLTEGCSFNIFFLKEGIIYTPHLDTGILPGITRDILLSIFEELKIQFKEGYYKVEDLLNSEEAFATSSVRGIVPIQKVNNSQIALGKRTPEITKAYYQRLKKISENQMD